MNTLQREFEHDVFLKNELARLISAHNVRSIIETGTEYGGSANAFTRMNPVKIVVTMDIQRKVTPADLEPKVHFIEGDSREKLHEAILYVSEPGLMPTLFFFDAHTSIETDACPLLDELDTILGFTAQHPDLPKPVIVIHDCKVPGRDFGFDIYKDGPICWEQVSGSIEAIYGPNGYKRHYNHAATGSKRGCLFVEPI